MKNWRLLLHVPVEIINNWMQNIEHNWMLSIGLPLISYKALLFQPRKILRHICDVTPSNHHNSAMQVKKKICLRLITAFRQATNQIWASVVLGTRELSLQQFGRCNFLSDLTFLDVSSKKRYQRHFTYHLKAHTISNKLVSKVSAEKKGGGGGEL